MATTKPAAPSLDTTFDELKAIVERYARHFSVREGYVRNKRDYHLILKKPVVVAGRKKDELWFASIIQQKGSVGFYFYVTDSNKKLSPALLEHLDGKSCFHFKLLTPALKKDIDRALKLGLAGYKEKGWL